MESARVCLAPLRFGAGLKGKLLDAMMMQTPSVTTAIGAEGMALPGLPWPGHIAENAADIAAAAINLYQNQAAWEVASNHTIMHLQPFDANLLTTQLIEKITCVKQGLAQHRLNNFTGAMLKHHTMSSTKYLSQWIMEKNKS